MHMQFDNPQILTKKMQKKYLADHHNKIQQQYNCNKIHTSWHIWSP